MAVRLGNETAIIGDFPRTGSFPSGRDHEQDMRPTLVNLPRQLHAVERPRHMHVGKKHLDVAPNFQHLLGGFSIVRFGDRKSRVFQCVRRVKA